MTISVHELAKHAYNEYTAHGEDLMPAWGDLAQSDRNTWTDIARRIKNVIADSADTYAVLLRNGDTETVKANTVLLPGEFGGPVALQREGKTVYALFDGEVKSVRLVEAETPADGAKSEVDAPNA